jgi:hypothetical protein
MRKEVLDWLGQIGVAGELESTEFDLLSTPLGALDSRKCVQESWKAEGMVVLAWALMCANVPPVHVECEPSDIAKAMGFLDRRENTPLSSPRLRSLAEIEKRQLNYLALHWRLRQFCLDRSHIDFISYVSACTWASLTALSGGPA